MDKYSPPDIPYWILLIRHYLKKQYVRNGLTIPYLIGARTVVEPDLPMLSIHEFLLQASEYKSGITIMRCRNIGEYVLAELDTESRKYSLHYQNIGHLYVTDDSMMNMVDLPQLVEYCTYMYAECMENKTYSRVDGQWEPFSKTDMGWLQEVANNEKA
jgi:hypothetical protein